MKSASIDEHTANRTKPPQIALSTGFRAGSKHCCSGDATLYRARNGGPDQVERQSNNHRRIRRAPWPSCARRALDARLPFARRHAENPACPRRSDTRAACWRSCCRTRDPGRARGLGDAARAIGGFGITFAPSQVSRARRPRPLAVPRTPGPGRACSENAFRQNQTLLSEQAAVTALPVRWALLPESP